MPFLQTTQEAAALTENSVVRDWDLAAADAANRAPLASPDNVADTPILQPSAELHPRGSVRVNEMVAS
jgi:hypothetical protein